MTAPVMVDVARLRAAYEKVRDELLAERMADGHWVGELSSSALSTATAVSALAVVRGQRSEVRGQNPELAELISRGVDWLVGHQNEDGGFGDTDLSHSNIATTYLVVAALHLAGVADRYAELIQRANGYIAAKGSLTGLRQRYGIDKTFVVPIMTNLALAGLVEWREVDPLPFELACVPQSWYRFVGMPVVSYAIPALVAIGQARYFHAPPWNPITRMIRSLAIGRSLRVLRNMQPESGGYLEATPLTSFVVMSLASIGRAAHEVTREGVKFLINSVRPDGSWPIDTNLATWNTTLAINALAGGGEDVAALLGPKCLEWLHSCQHLKRHPFTGADPGGFGWSDLSGAVPDADDTPGALLALAAWYESARLTTSERERIQESVAAGLCWLLSLQNSDRGWPTFCRGWGKLPFDRSGADLTAHAIRAIAAWQRIVFDSNDLRAIRIFEGNGIYRETLKRARFLGADYLVTHRNEDATWSPLWFGNQNDAHEDNPVYGTAKALFTYRDLDKPCAAEATNAISWFIANQNTDGGWGSGVWQTRKAKYSVLSTQYSVPSTPREAQSDTASNNSSPFHPKSQIGVPAPAGHLKSSVEETALAVEALLAALPLNPEPRTLNPPVAAVEKGLTWLIERVENGQHRQPAPIGFYFAKLWYYERLYPLTFTVAALGRACRQLCPPEHPDSHH
jgi:squalene-hopene/tetraprenyl-beta-curcumene cyclase